MAQTNPNPYGDYNPFDEDPSKVLKPRRAGAGTNNALPVPGEGGSPQPLQPPAYNPAATDVPDNPGVPGPAAGATQTGPKATSTVNYGGGWNESHGQDPAALALKKAMDSGLTGQAAVDSVNQNPALAGQIAWYPEKGQYGAPSWYAAPNGAGGPLDLIARGGGGGTSGGSYGGGSSFQAGEQPNTPYTPSGIFGGGYGASAGQAGGLFDLLMKRAGQSLNVDPNDPNIKGRVDAYNAQEQRAAKNYGAATAERAGPNANIDAETRSASEKVGQDTAGFEATLMGQELASRRQEIEQALSGAQGLLTSQQQMQLQEELAQLTLAQQKYQFSQGQGQQESQFERELGQRGFEFDSNDQFRNSPLGS